MSISLNNHESRIKALENMRNNWVKEIKNGAKGYVWFQNGLFVQWGLLNRPAGGDWHSWAIEKWPVPFSEKPWIISANCVLLEANASNYDNNISINYGKTTATEFVFYEAGANPPSYNTNFVAIGLKLYYNFSYNIYRLIYTFLEFLFKEV